MFARIPEPELMLAPAQVEAYAKADFSEPHQRYVELCRSIFGPELKDGWVLDLGCGPGDVTFRFARAFPQTRIIGVDGSPGMLQWARAALEQDAALAPRIQFLEGYLPRATIPNHAYAAIISNSLLHHLPDPLVLWQTVRAQARPGTRIGIMDLLRPATESAARDMVAHYAAGEPAGLQTDFFNSLCAAYRPEEVRQQLGQSTLAHLKVEAVSNRHWLVSGII